MFTTSMSHWMGGDRGGTAATHRRGPRGGARPKPSARTRPRGRRCARLLPLVLLVCLACTGAGTAATLILPLGDSITHGSDAYPSYRPLLYQDLRALGYDVDFVGSLDTPALRAGLDPDNEGHSGYTTAMVLAGLPGWLGMYPSPEVALVHLGTNDAIQSVSRDRTIADLRGIVKALRARNPSTTILVAQIIPTSVASINTRIEALNREIAGLESLSTPQSPIVIVDQYSGYNGQTDNQAGGVHPLSSGERKMASRWKASLIPVLDRVAPPIAQYGPHAVPGRIEAEDYDAGGYADTTPGNSGGVYRQDDVDIEYAASEGSYAVGWIRDGESLSYTANVTTGGPFTLNARVASPNIGRAIVLEVNGTVAAEIPVPNTGSFETYATVTLGVALPAGQQCLALRFFGDGQNLNWLEFLPGAPAPTVTVPPLPPQDVADLRNTTYEPTSITWTWTDPIDPTFANVTVCLDGVPAGTVERGVQGFTATDLDPATPYTIGTRTRSTAGTASATWANHTARTAPDTTPPASVTDLGNTTYAPTSITWTWTDPADPDFANVTVYLDGAVAGVVVKGVRTYHAADLAPGTSHTIATTTADISGNANTAWVNHTATTAPAPELPLAVPGGAGAPTDTNGDGLCDDVNGNGRQDFADVVLYFNQMTWIAANEPVAAFDYNGNGRIDFADVVWLFNAL
jgi:PKD repeat protein